MTINNINRLPVIGDTSGIYFVKSAENPSINGVYSKAHDNTPAEKMGAVAPELNGTNYLMVYGTGTPTENAAELKAAYNEAKKMPRYLGSKTAPSTGVFYKGQTYYHTNSNRYFKFITDATDAGSPSVESVIEITEIKAKSTRTTLIVAPGEYDFGDTAFTADTDGINIVSLTGCSDVIISSTEENSSSGYIYGIKVTANNALVKGIDCKTNNFYINNNLDNLICEYCIGGDYSFGSDGSGSSVSGTFNNCKGGNNSFGSDGATLVGTFNNCIGGDYSFGESGTLVGKLINCKLTTGTFPLPTRTGKIYNCIAGSGALINNPLPIFADNDAAASLAVGTMYRTSAGVQMIKW